MEQFNTLLEAAELAVTRSDSWSFVTSAEKFNTDSLLIIAETADDEDPIDEDSFYVVSPSGAIGLCLYGENIDWLFLSDYALDEDLPATFNAAAAINFCPDCGSAVVYGSRFCGECGFKLT